MAHSDLTPTRIAELTRIVERDLAAARERLAALHRERPELCRGESCLCGCPPEALDGVLRQLAVAPEAPVPPEILARWATHALPEPWHRRHLPLLLAAGAIVLALLGARLACS
jgi:hypothetical protein